jgi:transcription antitermination factor NusG
MRVHPKEPEEIMSSIDHAISGFQAVECATRRQPDHLPWYAVQVQSRRTSLAFDTLCGKGYETYLPLYRSERRWSDRVKKLDLPLFPGYLFSRFDVLHRLPVLTTPGVTGIVGAGKTPLPVEDEEIEAVRVVLRSGMKAQPWPFLGVGSRVYLETGPLAGVEGIIVNTDKVYRLVVSVSLLQRSVACEIEREWARPIPDGAGPRAVSLSGRTQHRAS